MAIKTSKPTGDVVGFKQWSTSSGTNHFALIDEGMYSKNISDYVFATGPALSDQYTFPADGPATMTSCSRVWVDMYMKATVVTGIPGLRVALYLNTTLLVQQNYQISADGIWRILRFTFTGLSMTRTQYNTLRVQIQSFDAGGTELFPVTT